MIQANAVKIPLATGSVHCVVTSPPYFGLRKYFGGDAQIGLEPSPDEYVAAMVAAFREVWRVLRDDGTVWLNLGDSYNGGGTHHGTKNIGISKSLARQQMEHTTKVDSLKPKDQLFIPHRVAMALQADGWYCRSTIIWHKPNPMPESVTDRPTNDFEYVFLLAKQARYFYDADAVREEHKSTADEYNRGATLFRAQEAKHMATATGGKNTHFNNPQHPAGRNKRAVWTVPTSQTSFAHFATFPPALITPMIRAGTSERGVCPECGAGWQRVVETERTNYKVFDHPLRTGGVMSGGVGKNFPDTISRTIGWQPTCTCGHEDTVPATVFDPFAGSGTTMIVARNLGRRGYGIDLSHEYCGMARDRLSLDFGASGPAGPAQPATLTPMDLLLMEAQDDD